MQETSPKSRRSIWLDCGLEVVERILGLGDRRDKSPTRGCYDRLYWKYKLIDYPSAWFQAATEYLAILYNIKGSLFQDNPQILKWSQDAFGFTLKICNRDGSLAEAYPYERSFCATAFIGMHLFSAANKVKIDNPDGLRKMACFLKGRFGNHLSNQLAAGALTQLYAAEVLKEEEFSKDATSKLKALYDNQTNEGYFEEYGGLDIGYLSVTLSLLARIDKSFPGIVDKERIQRALSVIDRSVEDDGTYEYQKMSRRTQFLYPFGLAYFKSPVLGRLKNGLQKGIAIRPSWLDDRYVSQLAIDHLLAAGQEA
ncbi:MAG: hypothetical protein JW869_03075 [Candidatus Omnitrophica bacterium]|nr:hypothetical protein [Candidatus Omnitrophota bacterium]